MTRDDLKEIFTQWKYKGNRLAPAHQIARRIVAFPFIKVFEIALIIFVVIGWGVEEAKYVWKELP